MKWIACNESDNEGIAKSLIAAFPENRIFCLSGNLGAGKTTFIKSVCKILGVNTLVSSPTFSIINEYDSPSGGVYHFDFYRIKSEQEAFDTGCEEYFYSGNYCFIEWAEKIPGLIPEEAIYIEIVTENEQRIFNVAEKK
ncbi:MAG: tRNA (adenosine(37)-N6)-threonylcarbamoyltransferase complex ATPase subunit type 1 TsaE [Bacteroidia bacterium]|nr:tRNA (adenosine(37)-N6)-threonylcarbamoyltransferase complex ATPase subunit type 1 TsaE [Bacteroidia bacterium]